MKVPTIIILCFLIFSTKQSIKKTNKLNNSKNPIGVARQLREDINLISQEMEDKGTQEMKEFFDEIEEHHANDNEAIEINTNLNSDKSSTTGNVDDVEDLETILPSYDDPVMDEDDRAVTKEHHKFLDKMINVLNPDFFSEDPQMFLGDHDSYFKIVKKRSILFYYLSRIILYTTLLYIILKFISGKGTKTNFISRETYSKKKFNCFVCLQIFSLTIVIIGSLSIFTIIGEPKGIIDDAGSNLIYEFRNINVTSHEISDHIDEINNDKIKIPIDIYGVFSVTNTIKMVLESIEEDVNIATDFSKNMLENPYLTNYSIALTIFFMGCLLFGISYASIVKKSPNFQIALFFISGLSLSYVVYTMGMFFANYSALHDICNSVITVNERPRMPEQGIGLIKYIGCTQENVFFQQLYINLKAQNSARKLFNNEMFKIHRNYIRNPEQGLRVAAYLKKIDSSSVEISSYANLLDTNKMIIYKLMSINKCNMIKEWLGNAETTLCYDGSSSLLMVFWLFGIIIIGFIGVNLSANLGSQVLQQYTNLNILKTHSFKKERYANDIKLE